MTAGHLLQRSARASHYFSHRIGLVCGSPPYPSKLSGPCLVDEDDGRCSQSSRAKCTRRRGLSPCHEHGFIPWSTLRLMTEVGRVHSGPIITLLFITYSRHRKAEKNLAVTAEVPPVPVCGFRRVLRHHGVTRAPGDAELVWGAEEPSRARRAHGSQTSHLAYGRGGFGVNVPSVCDKHAYAQSSSTSTSTRILTAALTSSWGNSEDRSRFARYDTYGDRAL